MGTPVITVTSEEWKENASDIIARATEEYSSIRVTKDGKTLLSVSLGNELRNIPDRTGYEDMSCGSFMDAMEKEVTCFYVRNCKTPEATNRSFTEWMDTMRLWMEAK